VGALVVLRDVPQELFRIKTRVERAEQVTAYLHHRCAPQCAFAYAARNVLGRMYEMLARHAYASL